MIDHVPQAVAEMYGSAKYLQYDPVFFSTHFAHTKTNSFRKRILRGALTKGHECIFLIVYLNENGHGGTYSISPTINIYASDKYPYHVLSPGPDIVAGILAYWVCCIL